MKRDIAIWGASIHARVVAEALRLRAEIVSVFVDNVSADRDGETFDSGVVVGGDDALAIVSVLRSRGIERVALGFGDCRGRWEIGRQLMSEGLRPVTVVHPRANVSPTAELGVGVFVGASAVIEPNASVGDFTIVNCGAVVCHDTQIGQASHLSPNACLCGGSVLGERVWLGAGSTVRDQVTIGADSVVGCGSNVVDDLPAGHLAYGNPARVVRDPASES